MTSSTFTVTVVISSGVFVVDAVVVDVVVVDVVVVVAVVVDVVVVGVVVVVVGVVVVGVVVVGVVVVGVVVDVGADVDADVDVSMSIAKPKVDVTNSVATLEMTVAGEVEVELLSGLAVVVVSSTTSDDENEISCLTVSSVSGFSSTTGVCTVSVVVDASVDDDCLSSLKSSFVLLDKVVLTLRLRLRGSVVIM